MQLHVGKLWKNWKTGKNGATAVEFSLVGIPFTLMIIGTLEMAMMFTAQSVLHESTFTAARMIRTGQIQQAEIGGHEQIFREAVCDFAALLIPCDRIQFQVRKLDSFGDAQLMPPAVFDEDGNLVGQQFDPGGVNDVVMIRVTYNYPIITPLMRPMLSNAQGGRRSMISTIILQNEPYEFVEE